MAASSPFPPLPTRLLPPSGLVGREREQQRLDALLAAAADGHGRLVLVGGEAGIGKTALVRALAAEAAARGAAVLVGGCYDLSATPPYGPWRELLTGLPSGDGLPPLPAALTDVGDPAPGGEAALFRQVLGVLAAVAATRPAVVVLEDLHWADPASLDLLRFLARQFAAVPLLLVATYRSDELTRRHPLAHLLPTLVREAPTERLDLHRLDDAALRGLVAGRYPLPTEAEARLVVYLQRAAEGNPFYAQELLRSLEEERVLCPGEPHWTLGNLERVRVPALLQQVVEGRLARLGERARDHLAVAAVVGQRVPLAVWQSVGSLTEDEVLQTVERAVEAQLLEAGDDGAAVGFAHALVREVLYEGVLPPRRRVWHRRVAEVLADAPGADPDAVADHFQRAGDARAADWLLQAGERAQGAYALLTARDRFLAAVALLEGDAARAGERGWLLYRTGRLLRTADPAQGGAYLDEAERVARAVGDPVLAAYALFDRGSVWCYAGDQERGLAAMTAGAEALDALPHDHIRRDPALATWVADVWPGRHARSTHARDAEEPTNPRHGTLAVFLALAGRFSEARAVGAAYLAQVEGLEHPDPAVLSGFGDAETAVALTEAAMGHPEPARAEFRRASAAYRAIDHLIIAALPLGQELTEVNLPLRTTDVAGRRSLLAAIREAASRVPDLSQGWVRRFELDGLLIEGAWDEAERLARTFLEGVAPSLRQRAFLGLGTLARWRGEPAEAWSSVRAGLPSGPAAAPGQEIFQNAVALLCLGANLARDGGDLPTAAAWLAALDRWLVWSGTVRWRADARLLWAGYHRVAGDPDRARQAAGEALAEATAPHQPLALLAAHRFLGELATDAAHWDEAEPHLLEALALAEACAVPFERALTLLALAELRAAEGRAVEATRLLEEVRAIGRPLGAAPLLARVDALAARLAARPTPADPGPRLSAREVEVLRLVAAGRSNPEIAQDLSISPRTVTTHLTHIFAKLDVDGRAEATALAVRHGLI